MSRQSQHDVLFTARLVFLDRSEPPTIADADRFALAASQVVGKRLKYAELIGKVGETTPF